MVQLTAVSSATAATTQMSKAATAGFRRQQRPDLRNIAPGQLWFVEVSPEASELPSFEHRAFVSANVVIYDRVLSPLVAAALPLGKHAEPATARDQAKEKSTVAPALQGKGAEMPALVLQSTHNISLGLLIMQVRDWCYKLNIEPVKFTYSISGAISKMCIQFSLNDKIDRFAIGFPKGTRLPACSDLDFMVWVRNCGGATAYAAHGEEGAPNYAARHIG